MAAELPHSTFLTKFELLMRKEVKEWLDARKWTPNVRSFLDTVLAENLVDLPTLLELTEADMSELGFPFGPRKALWKALQNQ